MTRVLVLMLGLAGLLLAAPPVAAKKKPRSQFLVITNVNLVDVRDGTQLPNMTVVIRDGRIVSIARHALVGLDRNVHVVNATGKLLLLGRWEMKAGTLAGLETAEVGQGTDLLLLDEYPLSDLRDTGKVWAAVIKGKFLDRRALEQMAAEAAKGEAKQP